MTTNSQILGKNLQFSRHHLQIFCASDGLQMKYLSIQIEHHFIKSVFTRLEQKVEEKKNSGNRKWNRGSILITRVSSFMNYSGFSGSVPTRGPSLVLRHVLASLSCSYFKIGFRSRLECLIFKYCTMLKSHNKLSLPATLVIQMLVCILSRFFCSKAV